MVKPRDLRDPLDALGRVGRARQQQFGCVGRKRGLHQARGICHERA